MHLTYIYAAPPPPALRGRGGGLDFLTQQNPGELKCFKINGGEKKRGKGEFLKFSLGGKLLEMKLQTENNISE